MKQSLKVGLFALGLLHSGCATFLPEASVPLAKREYRWDDDAKQDRLLVYLIGRKDSPEDFERRGFLEILSKSGIACDVWTLDAHVGYYFQHSIVDRVQEDVIEPARESGYKEIWVVGNSMGGLGALLTERLYPGSWDRLILLAPFLGDDASLYRAFDAAGGVKRWKPETDYPIDAFAPKLWAWLKELDPDSEIASKIMLGYGRSDRLADSIAYLVPMLPDENVFEAKGGHDWRTWKSLWERILASLQDKKG